MKKIILIVVIIILLGLKYTKISALDFTVVNEINEVKLNESKQTLEISGWGLINDAQNYYNENTHSYQLSLKSKDDLLVIDGVQKAISHTNTMFLVGVRYCNDNEYLKDILDCNNYYENIGFMFSIPLSKLKMDQDYVATLSVTAKKAQITRSTEVYFPNKQTLTLKHGKDNYIIDSKLHNMSLNVLGEYVYATDHPGESRNVHQSKGSCNYNKNLYFDRNTKYNKIFDKMLYNNTTYYQVSGTETQCRNNRMRVKEGNDISPMWIASPFIEHIGDALTIKTRRTQSAPIINVTDHPTLYTGESLDVFKGVTAYDFEGNDLFQNIRILNNTYEDKVGTYFIEFVVKDRYGDSAVAIKNIKVIRRNYPPVIAAEDVELKQYSPYNPKDYAKAFNQDKLDISEKIIADNTVDTSIVNTYTQCYFVTDEYLLSSEKCINVTVLKANSDLRFIQQKRLFYLENVPKFWADKEERLRRELFNDIIYDSVILSK